MRIQTVNVVIPCKECVNHCPFCVSRMNKTKYVPGNPRVLDADYIDRLAFTRANGCNTAILTSSNGEPLQSMADIANFGLCNTSLGSDRFRWIELQTTGVFLPHPGNLQYLRETIRVSTISLSICDLFDPLHNSQMIGMPNKLYVNIHDLCKEIKNWGFALRVSLNLTDLYNDVDPALIFEKLTELGVDQVTFKVLYMSGKPCAQDTWIAEHKASSETVNRVNTYIKRGKQLENIPLRGIRYSVDGLSVIIDHNCMLQEASSIQADFRYLILRENGKLYSRWDDPASLVF